MDYIIKYTGIFVLACLVYVFATPILDRQAAIILGGLVLLGLMGWTERKGQNV